MLDVEQVRKDFPMLSVSMHDHPLIYLDNGATTLKPQSVIQAICEYLSSYSANAHRGDYDLSHRVDETFENVRQKVANFIHAPKKENIVFTYGASDSLNLVAYGYGLTHLQEDDEIILSFQEHASNTLPWFDVSRQKGCRIQYVTLDQDGQITLEHIKETINEHTKIIAISHISNVLGYLNPIKEICQYAHQKGIIVVVDGAQSVPHMPVDVEELDCDFLAFSAHKMCGPTGVGILYGKLNLLEETSPTRLGGGSNSRYYKDGQVTLKKVPAKFEAGTPNIEGVIGLGSAIDYLTQLSMKEIHEYELSLRRYAVDQLLQLDNVIVYNPDAQGPIAFNIKGVFSQDAASLFNTYGIAIRAGHHCAKLLDNYLETNTTCRASLYFYNTREEIDQFIEICKKGDDFLDAFFG